MASEMQTVSGFMATSQGAAAAFAAGPSRGMLRGVVVLCPPLFEERKACAVVFAKLADALASEGFASLRLDPRGTGDSRGGLGDATLEEWRDEVVAARTAAAAAGVPVVLLGVRFGALLALAAHAVRPADAIVLWEPVATGADALRQAVQRKLVNDMAAFGATGASRGALDASWERGEAVDLDGYVVPAALALALRGFAPPAVPAATPTLLIVARAERALAGRHAADVQVHATPPFWSTVGLVDVGAPVDAIVAWLAARFPESRVPATAWVPPIMPSSNGETHVRFPSPRGTALHGVWHCRDSATPRARALFLSGWAGCRLGPHNVFVTLARRLAEEGVACLRFDFGGRGDSEGDPSATSIASMADDARAALAWLRGQGPDSAPLAVVAICSGCKVAISVAAKEPDIRQLCLWSPEPMGSLRPAATNRRKARATLRAYAVKLLRPETWRKLLTGRVRGAMVGKALLRQETRSADEATREDAVLAQFRGYRGRVFAVFGGGDPEAVGSEAAYAAFFARHGIPCERRTIPRAGHSFYRAEWAEELMAATAQALGVAGPVRADP